MAKRRTLTRTRSAAMIKDFWSRLDFGGRRFVQSPHPSLWRGSLHFLQLYTPSYNAQRTLQQYAVLPLRWTILTRIVGPNNIVERQKIIQVSMVNTHLFDHLFNFLRQNDTRQLWYRLPRSTFYMRELFVNIDCSPT